MKLDIQGGFNIKKRHCLFILVLFFWALTPSVLTPWIETEVIRASSRDFLLLSFALIGILAIVFRRPAPEFAEINASLLRILFPALGLLLYAGVSTLWSGMESGDAYSMIFTLLCTASAVISGFFLSYCCTTNTIRNFLWVITVSIAIIALIYSAQSLLDLGLRSDVARYDVLGFQRVRGPLFGSATGHLILIPALGFTIQQIIASRENLALKMFVAFAISLALIGLGSRAGLALVAAFAVLSLFFSSGVKNRATVIALVLLLLGPSAYIVGAKADTSRLNSFEDAMRATTHMTAISLLQDRSLDVNFFGSGYGSIWPWYQQDISAYNLRETGSDKVYTSYGASLYHPHSMPLVVVVELGVIGVGLLLILSSRLILNLRRKSNWNMVLVGTLIASLSMFFDLVIMFKSHQINTIWWLFLFGTLSLLKQEQQALSDTAERSHVTSASE